MIRENDTTVRAAYPPPRVTPPLPELGDVRTTETVTRRLRQSAAIRQPSSVDVDEGQLILMGFIAGTTFGIVLTAACGVLLVVLL